MPQNPQCPDNPGLLEAERQIPIQTLRKNVQEQQPLRVLDLYCGRGGVGLALSHLFASKSGHHLGVDIADYSDSYPGTFLQKDASDLRLSDIGRKNPVDLVWASPPCKAYARPSYFQYDNPKEVHDTIPELNVREVCQRLGKHYVIENVEGCDDLRDPIKLAGTAFGLRTRFTRLFETSFSVDDYTDIPASSAPEVTVGMDGESAIADAKHIPACWPKEAIRAAIPGCYVAYILSHCPTLPDIHPPGDPENETYLDRRTADSQEIISDY